MGPTWSSAFNLDLPSPSSAGSRVSKLLRRFVGEIRCEPRVPSPGHIRATSSPTTHGIGVRHASPNQKTLR